MREVWRDVVVAVRTCVRAPGLAAGVAVTIGLGVGAGLAIFALLHDELIARSPFRDPAGLVVIENTGRYYYGGNYSEGVANPFLSGPDFADLERQVHTLSAVGGAAGLTSVMTGGDRPRPIWRTLVTPQLLPLLGARPRLGRLLAPSDFQPGAQPAALLTESMWRRHFGGDPGAVGKTIRLDDQAFTVVGVLPDAVLRFLAQPEGLLDRVEDRQLVTPLLPSMAGQYTRLITFLQRERDAAWFPVFGRLAPGQTPQSAASEVTVIARRLAAEHPKTNGKRGMVLTALEPWHASKVGGTTTMLLAAALLMFLVASCNAAGLVLAESVSRETETAVRQAIGAGAMRLVRLELVRAIVLAVPGGILAVLMATATLFLVDRTLAGGSGTIVGALLVPRAMLAGAVITSLSGLIVGGTAAWSLRRRSIAETLKEGGPNASASRRRQRLTRILVATEVAAATVLVLGAGLMLRSVRNVVGVDLGFDVRHSLTVQVRLPPARYPKGEDQRVFFQQALRRIRAMPGVAAAGAAVVAPLTGTSASASGVSLILPGGEKRTPEHINVQSVMPGYLEALDIKLVRGRWFSDGDYATGGGLLVDQAFCAKYLGSADPLQTRVEWDKRLLPVVGVVANVRRDGPFSAPVDMLYTMEPFDSPVPWAFIVVRAAGSPAALGPAIVRDLTLIDPGISIDDPQAVSELFARTFATRRRLLLLLGSAAVIVALLTAFSLVSALGQFVAARRREIAIRMAIGADGTRIAGLLARHVGIAIALGLGLGAFGGLLLARTLSNELFEVRPSDPFTFAATLAAVAVVAVLASAGPAWRAARLDAARSLRAQ